MKISSNLLALAIAFLAAGRVSSGEIVKRDVYYYGSDSTASQYVFQGDKRRSARASRYDSSRRLAPRYRPVRSSAGIRYGYGYGYGCSYYVAPHCGYPVSYRSRGASVWFYPGGCRTVVRMPSPVIRR